MKEIVSKGLCNACYSNQKYYHKKQKEGEKMINKTVPIDKEMLSKIKCVAKDKGLKSSQLMRMWIIGCLKEEEEYQAQYSK